MKLLTSLMIIIAMLTVACASDQAEAPKKVQQQGGNEPGTTGVKCVSSSTQITTSLMGTISRPYDGNKISVFNETETARQTFCDILLSSARPVVIFQFAGTLCLSCQEEAKYYEQTLRANGRNSKIAHVIIFSDYRDERLPANVNTFKYNFSPSALFKMDDEQRLWAAMSPNKTFGTTLVLDRNGNQFFVDRPGAEHEVMQNADRLANGF